VGIPRKNPGSKTFNFPWENERDKKIKEPLVFDISIAGYIPLGG
jgi:hypothetical protein